MHSFVKYTLLLAAILIIQGPVHEIGHFLGARMAGVEVIQVSINPYHPFIKTVEDVNPTQSIIIGVSGGLLNVIVLFAICIFLRFSDKSLLLLTTIFIYGSVVNSIIEGFYKPIYDALDSGKIMIYVIAIIPAWFFRINCSRHWLSIKKLLSVSK